MEMPSNKWLFILLWSIVARGVAAAAAGEAGTCGDGETATFEKWSGVRAASGEPVFVLAAAANERALSGACTTRCRELPDCAAVVVSHGRGGCTGYTRDYNRTLLHDNDVSLFIKICMKLPQGCEARWWALETAAGYRLHGGGSQRLQGVSSLQCSRALLHPPDGGLYRSAQWTAAGGGGGGGGRGATPGAELSDSGDTGVGACVLSAEDKYTEPESYRVANFRTYYKENQCRHDFSAKIERCSYEEYFNQTLKHVELTMDGISKDECKMSCEREQRFVCRGFSWRSEDAERVAGAGQCTLHSEDILTLGSWLLRRAPSTTYYRRVICLNISVECSEEEMVVTYRPRGSFPGRVYVPGREERCGATADGGVVRLALPLRGPCDVNFAYAVSNGALGSHNKTMAYAMVMIQNNPIIQTSGDRWVRVGCAPGAGSARAPHTLDAALTVSVDTAKATVESGESWASGATGGAIAVPASAVFNTSGGAPPPLTMYVVRPGGAAGEGREARGAVSLGEVLELRVETTDKSEIEAYHLVASSRLGDSSVLLLDNRGCPTGQVDFPELIRSWAGGNIVGGGGGGSGSLQRLSARFKAFRFPNSHVVRFSLMVRFCETQCPKVECGPGSGSRSRPTRRIATSAPVNPAPAAPASNEQESAERADVREETSPAGSGWDMADGDYKYRGTQDPGLVVAQSGAGAHGCEPNVPGRVPLELELVVGSRDLLTADTLVRAEHQPDDGGVGATTEATMAAAAAAAAAAAGGFVCMHEALVAVLVLAWLVVQLLLLVGCCVVVKRYRKFAEMASQKEYQAFDNIGFDTLSTHARRVHWPDQNVDILHAN